MVRLKKYHIYVCGGVYDLCSTAGYTATWTLGVSMVLDGPGCCGYTPEVKNSSPLKNDGWKMAFLLGWLIFRGELLNFQGVYMYIQGIRMIFWVSGNCKPFLLGAYRRVPKNPWAHTPTSIIPDLFLMVCLRCLNHPL